MRLSMYEPIKQTIVVQSGSNLPAFQTQLFAGALSGAISSAVMCPADVIKIRLQTGEAQYRGVSDALVSIARHEGISKLWRGVVPTSTRASVVAAAELGLYDASKQKLGALGLHPPRVVTFASSMIATVGAIALSFPIDVTKTILINQGSVGVAAGAIRYTGMAHCFVATVRSRGFFGIYRGVMPSLGRQIVCNYVTFATYEELKTACWAEISE